MKACLIILIAENPDLNRREQNRKDPSFNGSIAVNAMAASTNALPTATTGAPSMFGLNGRLLLEALQSALDYVAAFAFSFGFGLCWLGNVLFWI